MQFQRSFSILEITHGTPVYHEMVALREEVLRKPLGLRFSQQDIAGEKGDIHLAAFLGGELVGTVLLRPESDKVCRLRQMAVRVDLRRQGVGRRLVERAERLLAARDYRAVTLHAREAAVPFYEALGYVAVGEPFTEVTIPHVAMQKVLAEHNNSTENM